MKERRGVALVMVLAASALVASLSLVALRSMVIRARLAGDARWAVEGQLVAATAIASTRIARRGDIDTLSDGGGIIVPAVTRSDGWSWHAVISRSGALVRIVAVASYAASDGTRHAARRSSLMLARDPADTVRVLAQRARF